jgi:hypothetical protein
MRLAAPRSVVCNRNADSLGCPRDMTRRAFAPVMFSPTPSPVAFRRRVHPPSSCLLFRALRRAACFRSLQAIWRQPVVSKAPPMGFGWALFATSSSRSHLLRKAPPPSATVRPRRSSRPRRFAPRPVLRVCFTPQPRTGFPPLRGLFLRAEPRRVVPGRCPRVVSACASAVSRAKTPTCDFRALLSARSPVASDNGLSRPMLRAPLGLVLLRVLPPRTTAACAASALGLERNEPAAPDPRRLVGTGHGLPGIRLPTRSRFSACSPPSLTTPWLEADLFAIGIPLVFRFR